MLPIYSYALCDMSPPLEVLVVSTGYGLSHPSFVVRTSLSREVLGLGLEKVFVAAWKLIKILLNVDVYCIGFSRKINRINGGRRRGG